MKNSDVFKYPLMRIGAYLEKYGHLIPYKTTYKSLTEKAHIIRNNMDRGTIDSVKLGKERFVVMTAKTKKIKELKWVIPKDETEPMSKDDLCLLPVLQIGEFIEYLGRPIAQNSIRYAIGKGYIDSVDVDGQLLVVMSEKTKLHTFGK